MKDPTLTVIKSNMAVVIKDKFPKAKHHFLVLPLENIPSIFQVSFIHKSQFSCHLTYKFLCSSNEPTWTCCERWNF